MTITGPQIAIQIALFLIHLFNASSYQITMYNLDSLIVTFRQHTKNDFFRNTMSNLLWQSDSIFCRHCLFTNFTISELFMVNRNTLVFFLISYINCICVFYGNNLICEFII